MQAHIQRRLLTRRVIDYLLGTTAIATIANILYPILKYLVPPQIPESAQSSVTAGKVASLSPIQEKSSGSAQRRALSLKRRTGRSGPSLPSALTCNAHCNIGTIFNTFGAPVIMAYTT